MCVCTRPSRERHLLALPSRRDASAHNVTCWLCHPNWFACVHQPASSTGGLRLRNCVTVVPTLHIRNNISKSLFNCAMQRPATALPKPILNQFHFCFAFATPVRRNIIIAPTAAAATLAPLAQLAAPAIITSMRTSSRSARRCRITVTHRRSTITSTRPPQCTACRSSSITVP